MSTKQRSQPRVPPPSQASLIGTKRTIQVNHCRMPDCDNFGVPARSEHGKPGRSKDRDMHYQVQSTKRGSVPSVRCKSCFDNPPIKSNAGIVAEIERLTESDGLLRLEETTGCRHEDALREGLRHRVLDYLCEEVYFDPQLADRMRQWQHSGFSVHNQIRVKANDAEGRKQLARYMIRNPFALEKMTYDKHTGMVIYRSKFHASLKRNYQLLTAAQWLKLLLAHIPDKYEHLVRYYGFYSNRARGERKDDASADNTSHTPHRCNPDRSQVKSQLGKAHTESL